MKLDEEQCMKFPVVMRDKLKNGEIELPDSTQFQYDKIYAYRAVTREKNDTSIVTRDDFRSYYELGKKARGIQNPEKDPHYYGVSSFLDRRIAEQKMKFPRPNKKLAVGYIREEGGPQETNIGSQHVCWWLYEHADVSDFTLVEE